MSPGMQGKDETKVTGFVLSFGKDLSRGIQAEVWNGFLLGYTTVLDDGMGMDMDKGIDGWTYRR